MVLVKLMEYLKYNNIFLSGGAGVGKSFLMSRLIKEYRKNGKIVIALGSTGISAFNIGGVTLHSFFRFGRCTSHDELYYEDRKQKDKIEKLKRILKQCDLLIIDEISMVSALIMDMIYYRLTRLDFNGKLVVVGDFFQLPPVVRKEQQNSLFQDSYYAFASNAWNEFNFINVKLTLSKRTSDNKFYEYLFYIRLGQINDEIIKYLKSKLVDKNKLLSYEDNYTLLCATNKKTNFVNEVKLKNLKTKEYIFNATFEKMDLNLDDKSFKQWIDGLNLMQNLKIKIGAKIIFCVNNKEENYYNGEQGKVIDISYENDECFIVIEKSNGEILKLKPYECLLEDYELDSENKIEVKIKAKFIQYPIKLAYAITIHKSQGMSIDKLICDIDGIFEKGQLYVCLSRAIDPNNLKITYNYQFSFKDYFLKILKFDKKVKEFYLNTHFIDLEEENLNEMDNI